MQVDELAKGILSNPYSAPERAAWAIDCASPAVVEEWFFQQWGSCRQRGIWMREAHIAQQDFADEQATQADAIR